jgi:hypothetical protein
MELFFSHETTDLEIARSLKLRLNELAAELKCFFLAGDVFAKDEWEQRVRVGSGNCDAILCLAPRTRYRLRGSRLSGRSSGSKDKPWYLQVLDVDLTARV